MLTGSTRLPPPRRAPSPSNAAAVSAALSPLFCACSILAPLCSRLLPECLELSQCTVGRELRFGGRRREGAHAGHGGGCDDETSDAREHDRQHDRADDNDGGVADGFVLRSLHQRRQAEVQQVQAVECRENAKNPERGQNLQRAGNPRWRVRVDRHLERLVRVLRCTECRRQRVDDEREDEHADDREAEGKDGADEAGHDRYAIGAEEWQSRTDQGASDEAGDGSDGGQRDHIAGDDRSRRRGFRLDDGPFRSGRQQNVLYP